MLIDAFQTGFFDRSGFEALLRGGVGCITVNCGYWEDTVESLDSLARWRDLLRENSDLVVVAGNASDITKATTSGKVAVLLGFQNTDCLQGRIRFVEFWAEWGIRVLQPTYNNQNETGGSCYEANDSGLARFGREAVREMNRAGILIDISHLGMQTSLDVIAHSEKPVAATHSNSASLYPHKRNKSDEVLEALAERGGVLGCALYPNLTGPEFGASLATWSEMVARTVDLMGIDHVGIGSGRRYNPQPGDLDWARMGRWTRGVDYGAGSKDQSSLNPTPHWFKDIEDFRHLASGLSAVGFSPTEVAAIASGNWLRLFNAVL
jgi:microsomal dipeptidase-like Zn-dependent dipeptidase